MLNNISKLFPLSQLKIPVIALLVTLGAVGEEIKPVLSSQIREVTSNQKAGKEAAITPKVNLPTKDGIYLYGQSPQPNQIGQGYVVFQKQRGRLVGALYMPNSEFSCFQGTLEPSGELAMTVTGTPDAGSQEVATAGKLPSFYEDEPTSYAYSLALQDYHQINDISASDRRVLQRCSQ